MEIFCVDLYMVFYMNYIHIHIALYSFTHSIIQYISIYTVHIYQINAYKKSKHTHINAHALQIYSIYVLIDIYLVYILHAHMYLKYI
jgi:hypothetical protein